MTSKVTEPSTESSLTLRAGELEDVRGLPDALDGALVEPRGGDAVVDFVGELSADSRELRRWDSCWRVNVRISGSGVGSFCRFARPAVFVVVESPLPGDGGMADGSGSKGAELIRGAGESNAAIVGVRERGELDGHVSSLGLGFPNSSASPGFKAVTVSPSMMLTFTVFMSSRGSNAGLRPLF
jgi:hypothetical protein